MSAARGTAFAAVIAGALLGPAGAAAADPRCVCRYAGDDYFLGECVCMKTSGGDRYACCGRILNNTSWAFIADGCHVARTKPAARPGFQHAADAPAAIIASAPGPASPR